MPVKWPRMWAVLPTSSIKFSLMSSTAVPRLSFRLGALFQVIVDSLQLSSAMPYTCVMTAASVPVFSP